MSAVRQVLDQLSVEAGYTREKFIKGGIDRGHGRELLEKIYDGSLEACPEIFPLVNDILQPSEQGMGELVIAVAKDAAAEVERNGWLKDGRAKVSLGDPS